MPVKYNNIWHLHSGYAGYGVELPCEFKFQGDNFSSNWLKIKLKKEKFDVLNQKKTVTIYGTTFEKILMKKLMKKQQHQLDTMSPNVGKNLKC